MINNKDLQLNNKSYINKDFQTIFPEQLDLVQKLTNKWNPSLSNESDVGVVLLKSNAFIGDKNNYNLDKNVLECFMPSATQESSMRDLCERGGYNVGYYNSATTQIVITYTGELNDGEQIKLSKYNTVVTDVDNTVSYTLLKDCVISEANEPSELIDVIEGVVEQLYIENSNLIQLSNLDSNNRVYLPNTNVAENGIFIYNDINTVSSTSTEPWDRVDNLNIQPINAYIYKFGFDSSKGLPYIEFPNNIADIIGNGLKIYYTTTQGSNGNIKAGALTELESGTKVTKVTSSGSTDEEITKENLYIANPSPATNGKNPETIDEAYNSFNKIKGTFNTLVTCRDYQNAIYNIEEADSKPVVSNVVVTDRRTDFNYSNVVNTLDEYGSYNTYLPLKDKSITPYDLCLYPLKTIKTDLNKDTYRNSFTPSSALDVTKIKMYLENEDFYNKTISHNYKTLTDGDVYCFKNKYTLNVRIATTDKVNSIEQAQIVQNIKQSLYNKFYSRNIDYGYEIPYETILETIENADSRIRSVSLDEPEPTTYVLRADGNEVAFNGKDTNTYRVDLVAKNILEGKVSLFDFDTSFDLDFGYTNLKHYTNLKSAELLANISLAPETKYTIKPNEYIQIISPNLYDKVTYTYGVYYRYVKGDNGLDIVKANTDYKLPAGASLSINYVDSTNTRVRLTYPASTIIRPNFNMAVTNDEDDLIIPSDETNKFNSCGVEDTISIREEAKNEQEGTVYCYWLTSDGYLFNKNNYNSEHGIFKRILGINEYFILASKNQSEIIVYGSGTQLSYTSTTDTIQSNWHIDDTIGINTINDNGLNAFTSNDWVQIESTSKNTFTIQEMSIITLGEGDKITLNEDKTLQLSNEPQPVKKTINYTLADGTNISLGQLVLGEGIDRQIKSRLDITTTKENPQRLYGDQSVTFEYSDSGSEPNPQISGSDTENIYINFNMDLDLVGSDDVDLSVTQLSGDVVYTVEAITYTKIPITDNDIELVRNGDYITITANGITDEDETAEKTKTVTLPLSSFNETDNYIVLFYINSLATGDSVILSTTNKDLRYYNNSSVSDYASELKLHKGLNIVEIQADTTLNKLDVKITNTTKNVITVDIGTLNLMLGLNPLLGLSSDDEGALLKELEDRATVDGVNVFNYLNSIDKSKALELDTTNTLTSPEAFWDTNNVANRITIAELDIDNPNTNISIVKSSRL